MLRDRAASAALLIPPLFIVLWLGGPWIVGLIALIVLLAANEAFRLLAAAGMPSFPLLGLAIALVVAVGDSVAPALGAAGLTLAALAVVLVGVGALARTNPAEGLASWSTTVFGALYVALLGFVPRLGAAAPAVPDSAFLHNLGNERGWILALILSVWAFDTGAYLVGRRFGRRPFMAHISPRKTLEGVIGGTVSVTVVTVLLLGALGQPWVGGLVLGPLIAVAAQAGDLAESMLKRAARAKDSGQLIPGHGGMLDRIDSFLFAAPVMTLYVLALPH
jgi:phosphatidate cytidylyltransferase